MAVTIFDTPVVTPLLRLLARLLLRLAGWKLADGPPPADKYVLIAAPHTSNWDAPLMLAMALKLGLKLNWFVKDAFFKPPWGPLCRWLGAIGVDRSQRTNLVGQAIERFERSERLTLAVPPEGTRGKSKYWKSGFYYIALGAKVPISLGYLDYGRRVGSAGRLFHPTGDIQADMAVIRQTYEPVVACYPDKKGPIEVEPTTGAEK
ncbi:MAG: lysophospholipid acyltransferase family protein [Verrucomicrobia bacterium]|nr:lysophospholipid acyltransferase family protein [Verrucomicrobiota bacterium]